MVLGNISGPNGCTVQVQDALKRPWPENAPNEVPAPERPQHVASARAKPSRCVTAFKIDGVTLQVEGAIDGGTVIRKEEPLHAGSEQ